MKEMPFSEFKATGVARLLELCPILITYNGEPAFVVGKIEDTVNLSGMHPYAKRRFKLQEAKIRGAQGIRLERITRRGEPCTTK